MQNRINPVLVGSVTTVSDAKRALPGRYGISLLPEPASLVRIVVQHLFAFDVVGIPPDGGSKKISGRRNRTGEDFVGYSLAVQGI